MTAESDPSINGRAKRKDFGKYVIANPQICHGKLTFKGTRILVADVLNLVAEGTDWPTIVRQCHDNITFDAIAESRQLCVAISSSCEIPNAWERSCACHRKEFGLATEQEG